MTTLALNSKALNQYFGFLKKLDNNSKRKLIIKLTESLDLSEKKAFDLASIYGAWDDTKDSDSIIKEIRDSRVEKQKSEDFE